MALTFCGARSSSALILAAALMSGFCESRLAGSAILFSSGLRSLQGQSPFLFLHGVLDLVAALRNAQKMPQGVGLGRRRGGVGSGTDRDHHHGTRQKGGNPGK